MEDGMGIEPIEMSAQLRCAHQPALPVRVTFEPLAAPQAGMR